MIPSGEMRASLRWVDADGEPCGARECTLTVAEAVAACVGEGCEAWLRDDRGRVVAHVDANGRVRS